MPRRVSEEEKSLRQVREDASKVLDALEKEHEEDLARHLYAVYRTKSKRKAFKLWPFPSHRWTAWPPGEISRRRKSSIQEDEDNQDDPKPTPEDQDTTRFRPRASEGYTSVLDPELDSSSLQTNAVDTEPDDNEALAEARNILMHEFDLKFQKMVHERIHKAGKTPILSPDIQLPTQARHHVLAMVNRILDNVSTELKYHRSTITWKDVISQDIGIGQTVSRCFGLFDGATDSQAIQNLNLSQDTKGSMFPGNFASFLDPSRKAAVSPFHPKPSNDDLLAAEVVDIEPVKGYRAVNRVCKRARIMAQERKSATKRMRKKKTAQLFMQKVPE